MQVCKVFFQILNRQKNLVIMYLAIFLGVAMLVSSQGKENQEKMYESQKYNFAVFDEDQSVISKSLAAHLSGSHNQVKIQDDENVIQDELYYRQVNCVLRIPQGFGEKLLAGEAEELLQIKSIPGTFYEETFRGMVNRYLSMVKGYQTAGMSEEEAVACATKASQEKVSVKMADGSAPAGRSKMHYFFLYVPYAMIAIAINAIGTILVTFHKKDIKDRNNCSGYSLSRTNGQLVLGCVLSTLGLCAIFMVIVMILNGSELFTIKGALYGLNVLAFSMVSLGIVFFFSQILHGLNTLSMCGTVISLGMSFLCGIFVPLEMLGDGLVKVAHFLPAYWYVVAAEFVDGYHVGDGLGEFGTKLLVQLVFAVAFVSVGLAYSKKVRQR